jgi:glycosyltransferase involved in cell wall biosynthesis
MFADAEWRARCAAVIPCLNEEAAIGPVVEGVKRRLSTVIVVDDGSTDRTPSEAEAAGATVLRNARNLGKGASLRIGWAHARQKGFSWALCLDGDGQHAADDIPGFFECAARGSAQLIIGNRMTDASAMPWIRRFVNRWMSRRLSKVAGVPLPDSQCGFRLMNLDVWSGLPVQCNHFEIESEVLLAFLKAGFRVEFVPIRTVYKSEQSKINPFSDTIRWFKWWRGVRP